MRSRKRTIIRTYRTPRGGHSSEDREWRHIQRIDRIQHPERETRINNEEMRRDRASLDRNIKRL